MIYGAWTVARRDWAILLLALAGGGVDALMLLAFNVLIAAQTGNTVILAISLAQGRLANGLFAAVSVFAYVAGTALGEMILLDYRDDVSAQGLRSSAARTALVVELVLLVCFFVDWQLNGPRPIDGAIIPIVGLAGVAMGIQSALVLYIHVGPTTTYVTGTLTEFTTDAIRWLRLGQSKAAGLSRQQVPSCSTSPAPLTRVDPRDYGITWFTYFLGALASALLYLWIGDWVLVAPIAAIAVVVAFASSPTSS